jgi:hypothetical protein
VAEATPSRRIEAAGLSVETQTALQAAALRYFSGDGPFAAAVHALTGLKLPPALATRGREEWLLAWRSPTETLCLTDDRAGLLALERALAGLADGCLVNLSSAVSVLRLTGARIADLLCRLGGTASVPHAGEARRSRLADVPVLALGISAEVTLLIVDRVHGEHLLGWINETLLDWAL